jgi:hypothetical protein
VEQVVVWVVQDPAEFTAEVGEETQALAEVPVAAVGEVAPPC